MKHPSPAKVQIADYVLRKATFDDARALTALKKMPGHRVLSVLPEEEDDCRIFLQNFRYQRWGLPMVVTQNGHIVGFVYTSDEDYRNLNLKVEALFADPGTARLPFALYIHYLLWNFPLHRVYTYFPLTQDTLPYRTLYLSIGMLEEGILPLHAPINEQHHDVIFFGVVRDVFLSWLQQQEAPLGELRL